jgi:hypothetical protein
LRTLVPLMLLPAFVLRPLLGGRIVSRHLPDVDS